jgi:nucleotide-binding universal stress UspA family protein
VFGARLDVVHVCENTLTRGFGVEGVVLACPDLQRDLEQAARKQLDSLVSDDDRAILRTKTVVLTSNTPAGAIVGYAEETRADLILMGTHGRGAVAQLFTGNVAERVVRTAPCPVLTVRHPEREFVLPDALVAVAKA